MTYTWRVLTVATGRIDDVEGYETLGAAVWDIANSSWEDPTNASLSFVVCDGQVVATGLFGPGSDLQVVLSDGRRFRFGEPESYRQRGTDALHEEAIRACKGCGEATGG